MELNRLFDQIEKLLDSASWRTVFGEPHKEDGFGAGFGSGETDEDDAQSGGSGEGAGYGGGILADPAGVVRITGDHVVVEPYVNITRLGLAGIVLAAWSVFWGTYTIRHLRKR